MKNKRKLLVIISIILIVSIMFIILIFTLSKRGKVNVEEENFDEEKLEMQFNERFNNEGNQYISTLYHIEEEETGKYKIYADIPYLHIIPEIDNDINKEINNIFTNTLLKIYNESNTHTILRINYKVNLNNNILSLAIKCILKEGSNAQRTIIKTYNYNIETMKEVNILELITEEKKPVIQDKINKKIEAQVRKENTIIEKGFKVYRRDLNSDMYLLENSKEFYIENNILYIIYSYGNNSYTSDVDLIITKI